MLLLCLCCFSVSSEAQSEKRSLDIKAELTHAEFIGTTSILRDVVAQDQADRDRTKEARKHHKIPKNFMGRDQRPPEKAGTLPQGPDPIIQSGVSGGGILIEPLINMDGLISNFGSPHDPSGDVGLDYYVQAINSTRIGIYDKEGNYQMDFTGNSLWNSLGFSSAGDPIILFDQSENRWFITEFAGQGNRLLIAVSLTSDPAGAYNVFAFSTPSFPDYPKYAIWTDALVVTTNEDGSGGSPSYHIRKADLLAGVANPEIQRVSLPGLAGGPGFYLGTPVDWSGSIAPPAGTNQYIVRLRDDNWGGVSSDALELFDLNIVWGNVGASSANLTTIPTSSYDSATCTGGGFFDCIPQQGGGNVDGMNEFIMNQPHYQNFLSHESMVMAWSVDAGGNTSAVRWVELRRVGNGNWDIHQESTWGSNDGLQRFAPAICIDQSGNIGMAYSTSSSSDFIGLKFTGRRASDPLGEMTVEETVIVDGLGTNSAPQGGGNRYLDYPHMTVDPVNGRTFWYTSEYAGTGGNSRTRILAFELSRDTIDIGPSAIITPQDAGDLTDSETMSVTIENFGLTTQDIFLVGYIIDDEDPVIESVGQIIPPGGTYDHTFSSTGDFEDIGSYDVKFFTVLDNDANSNNDTLRVTVEQLPRWDAAVTDISFLDENPCADEKVAVATVTNYGSDVMITVSLFVELNGLIVDVVTFTQNLQTGQSGTINIPISNPVNGENELNIRTNQPNSIEDQIPENDAFERTFNFLEGEDFILEINTDFYPDDITWELADEQGMVLFEGGGGYPTLGTAIENFCLPPGACFEFTIFDSFGDGLCCAVGNGNYSISNGSGVTVVNSDGQFGDGETQSFCTEGNACALTVDVNASPESLTGVGDGVILVEASNGVGPYQYSIDNGATFQPSGMFSDLAGGTYTILILDANDCDLSQTVVVTTCKMEVVVVTGSESGTGAGDGTISIDASNGASPYTYSIDGGITFLSTNSFALLDPGTYEVVVEDDLGCREVASVVVSEFGTGVEETEYSIKIDILPNPTQGLFRVNVNGLQADGPFLDYQLYDVSGKKLHRGILARYDDQFTGHVSLIHYPDGMYFLKFEHQSINQLMRVIKAN